MEEDVAPVKAATKLPGLTARHFAPSSAGKYVPIFLETLPAKWRQNSVELLDEAGNFCTPTRAMPWKEFCARCQGFFDITLSGRTASVYSKTILWQLHSLMPETDGALKRLRALVEKVDQLAAPWLPL